MDKEKLITIAIGLAVGIIAATGYFAATKILPQIGKKNPVEIIMPKAQDKPTTPPPTTSANSSKLTLDLPSDNSSTKGSVATVSGQASPNATIIIFGNADQKVATAGADGKFKDSIKLEEGLNVISVTAIVASQTPNDITRNVTLEISQ